MVEELKGKPMLKQLMKIVKGVRMAETIDLRDLPEEEVKFVQRLVDSLRERARMKKEGRKEEIDFATWPLKVRGKLTRREIYDYL